MVETQALIWLGAVFAPLLPALGLLSNALHFYTMKLLATFLYQPPAKPYTASRTSNVAYSLMLGVHPVPQHFVDLSPEHLGNSNGIASHLLSYVYEYQSRLVKSSSTFLFCPAT